MQSPDPDYSTVHLSDPAVAVIDKDSFRDRFIDAFA
jgi:hypothetical protein